MNEVKTLPLERELGAEVKSDLLAQKKAGA